MIREQREDIITNNNTAQKQLNDILEKKMKRIDSIIITEPLYGDLDFSIIPTLGFGNLKSIILQPGSITNISNLPEGLETFECPGNLLISLDNLPGSLKEFIINNNYLTHIDLTQLTKLEKLNISNNQIQVIENLPDSLMEFKCENNKIQRLNLLGLSKLHVLHISNNTITIIENMPPNVADFQMENTPSIEFREIDTAAAKTLNAEYKRDYSEAARMSYTESLSAYFRIKNKYESELYKMKKQIHERAPSKQAAKKEARLIKPKCIKCKRPVGTCFSKKDNRYLAICGDTKNPCNLDIQLFNGHSNPRSWLLYAYKDSEEELKDEIIVQKLESLFGYIPDTSASQMFEKVLQNYTTNNRLYTEILEEHNEIYNNTHKNELIIQKMENIFRLNEQIRMLLDEYKTTNNTEILKTAVTLQVNQLLPETRNLRMLKYKIMEMQEHEVSNKLVEHHLIQYPNSFNDLDHEYGEPPRVIKFVV
jgi:hypothetical protein